MSASAPAREGSTISTGEGAQERTRMRRSAFAQCCNAVCPIYSPRIPFSTHHTLQCTLPVALHGREPMSGRECDGVWLLKLTLAIRIVNDYSLDQWLSPDVSIGIITLYHIRSFIEQHGAPSVAAGEEGARLRPPTMSDVQMAQDLQSPMTPTPEYKEHIFSAVCATVGHLLRAQETGVELEPSRSFVDSVRGPVPSPLHKVTHHFQTAFRHGPGGRVERLPVSAFVLDAITGGGNMHAESRPVGGGLVSKRSSKELVLSSDYEAEMVPGPGGGLVMHRTVGGLLQDVGTSVAELQATFGAGGYNRWLLSLVQPQSATVGGGAAQGATPTTGGSGPSSTTAAQQEEADKAAAKASADSEGGDAPTQV